MPVDQASEQVFQVALERDLLEQATAVVHIHEDVQVAARSGVAARDRSKHAHVPRATTYRDPLDLIAAPAQLLEV